jgi:hypothetical protein
MRAFARWKHAVLGKWEGCLLVGGLLLLALAMGYRLPADVWEPLFGRLVVVGAICWAVYGWRKIDLRGSLRQGNGFWAGLFEWSLRAIFRGAFSGLCVAALLALINGALASGSSYEAKGIVTGKQRGSGRHGNQYSLYVRDPRSGFVFSVRVPGIQHDLTRIGAEWPLKLREGALGWPFRHD